jgi:hypothetical protein
MEAFSTNIDYFDGLNQGQRYFSFSIARI